MTKLRDQPRCARCGKLISHEDVVLRNALSRFTPDSEFTSESVEFICFNCRSDVHRVRLTASDALPDGAIEIQLHDSGRVTCSVSGRLGHAIEVRALRHDERRLTSITIEHAA